MIDWIVYMVTGLLVGIVLANTFYTVYQIDRGEAVPSVFFIRLFSLGLVMVIAGRIYGWW